MQFQLFNIDQRSETEANLYGKFVDSQDTGMQTIKITGIISPIYFLPMLGYEDALITEINLFTKTITQIEKVKRTNIFHKNVKKELSLLQISFSQKIAFSSFESEYCEMIFSEFQNPVENLIILKGIKGPGILQLENLKKNTTNYENVTFMKNSKFPTLQTASISFELKNNNIFKFVYFNKSKQLFIKAQLGKSIEDASYKSFNDSREILSYLNDIIKTDGADAIIVHNFHLKSRLNIKDKIFCDIFQFASGTIKGRDYSIQEICNFYKINKMNGLEGDSIALIEVFESMNALNLGKEMAEISGYILNKCLNNCRAERIEYTLLHELYAKNYLFPPDIPKQSVKYAGGLVLEPLQGFYEDIILLLDFNSLYPSIIQEFNVCFSTIGSSGFYLTENNDNELLTNPEILSSMTENQEESFLPKILKSLVKRRQSVKEMIKNCKNPEERVVLDIRQKALKLTANSIYGCLGSPISRFCNFEMASFITAKGRELLNETKIVAEGMNMKVIYGDTDSIMIHTKYPGRLEYYNQAIESAKALVTKINSKYKNIEIELEKAFKKLLLYTKKKYASLAFDTNGSYVETKGLDIVRRDFCQASTDLSRSILNILLHDRESYTGNSNDNVILLNNTKETVESIYSTCIDFYNTLTKRPIEDFVISSVLSKDLSEYNTASNLPHINLAKRLKATKNVVYLQDDVVSYVIGEGDGPISSRSFHPEEHFKIDYLYYIKNQILPPLFRLVAILSYIHPEKIGMIFNVKDCVSKVASKNLTFITPCCEHIQIPSNNCMKCNELLPNTFYIQKICEMLREGCSKCYRVKGECIDCGVLYSNHLYRCTNCNKDLKFTFKNQEFDDLLGSIETSFAGINIPEIDRIVFNYSSISSYRMIDMHKYFDFEINNYRE